jgi:hypothetical protein
MGKTQGGVCVDGASSSRYGVSQEVVEGIRLIRPEDPGHIGSRAHLMRLSQYARGRTNRTDVSVSFNGSCGKCGHSIENHPEGQECTVADCQDCKYYIPNGQSYTDMRGSISVQSDSPPDQGLGAREIAINALLRHEVCHELYTNPQAAHDFFQGLQRMAQNGQAGSSRTMKDIWNILEDGMIETRERQEMPSSYRFISAWNKINPRVGREYTAREEEIYSIPDDYQQQGYVPEDADGNPLKIERREGNLVVVVPPGTNMCSWGNKPIYPHMQIRSALLAGALPEFEVGDLHPAVQAAFNECQPHIEAAITGNTADCIQRAQEIQKILVDHQLVFDPEEEKAINDAFQKMLEKLGPMVNDFQDPGDQGEQGPQPQNGGSGGSWGQPQFGPPQSGAAGGGDQDSEQQEDGSGDGSGGQPGEQQGDDSGSGSGAGSEPGSDQGSGSDSSGSGSADAGTQRGGTGGGDSSYHNPVSAEQMRKNEQEAKGSTSDQEVEQMKKEAQRNLENDRAQQIATDNARINKGHIEADQYKFDDRSSAIPQSEVVAKARQRPEPLADERGEMKRQGARIAKIVRKLKAETVSKRKRRMTGRLDHRKLSRAMSGEPRIMERRGKKFDVDLEVDISIDLSGSMSDDRLTQSYRAAMAVAYACQEAEIPITIYGWKGWGGNAQHIALKEKHSDDLTGIAGMFSFAGGGTPTGEAIQLSRRRLANSEAKNRIAIVQTDGGANDPDSAKEQAELARKQGLELIGLGYQVDQETMSRQFGENWESIDTFERTYDVIAEIIEKAARRAAGKKSRI